MSIMPKEVRWRTVIGQVDGIAKLVLGVCVAASTIPVCRIGRPIKANKPSRKQVKSMSPIKQASQA
jgi:hypothetical protein